MIESTGKPFLYIRDPLFHACVLLYAGNRFAESLGYDYWLTSYYLNDFVCLPFWLPVMVWITRRLCVRDHDGVPTEMEATIAFFVWATTFEIILPQMDRFKGVAIADPNDVIAYAIGGFLARCWWIWWYDQASENVAKPVQSNLDPAHRMAEE